MCRHLVVVFTILMICTGEEDISAQVQLPKGVEVPRQIEWQHIYNQYVVNLYDGLQPFTAPDDTSPRLDTPLQFCKMYYFVYSTDQQSGSRRESWYLLVRLDDESGNRKTVRITQHLGWVPRKYIAVRGEAIKDPYTEVHIKAFVRVPVADFVGDTNKESGAIQAGHEEWRIRPRKRPEDSAELMEAIRLYNFFFVMAKTGDNAERDWVFLSSQYEFGTGTTPIGWVKRKYVEEWLTREAIQWSTDSSRAKRPGKIWPSPEDALAAGPEDLSNRGGYIFIERFIGGKPLEQPPEWPRYPILKWDQEERYRQEMLKHPGWRLLRISVPGGFVDEKTSAPVADALEIQVLQQRLQAIQQRARRLEIVFVIDDTESMRPWFPVAAKAVEDIIHATQSLRNPIDLHVGVVFFNDENPRVPGHRPVTVIPLTPREQIPDLINNIKHHEVSAGGDPREMVFEGIIKAIETTNFTAEAVKLVIVIGDDGDKSDENDPKHGVERRIVTLLDSYTVPISFAAIQVCPPERLKERLAAATFRKQMETIVSLYDENITKKLASDGEGKLSGFPSAAFYTTNDAGRVTKVIADAFESLLQQQLAIQEQIARLRLGSFGAVADDSVLTRILKQRGLDVEIEKLKKIKGFQLVLDGYVWVPDVGALHVLNNRSSAEYVLFLSSAELELAANSVNRFIRNLGARWDRDAVDELLKTSLGEQIKSEWERVIKMSALQASGERIRRVLDGAVTLDDISELVVRSMRLADILRDEECTYKRIDNRWIRTNCETKPRGYLSVDGVVRYYWVRVRDEWP